MQKRTKKKRGTNHDHPHIRKPRKRKIKYPRKKNKISKAEAKRAVKELNRKKRKGVRQMRPRLKRINKVGESAIARGKSHKMAKINRGMIAKAIKESARVKMEYTRGDKTCYRETKFKVQPAFIDEYVDRILIGIEQNIPLICEEVLAKGRKTLMVKEGNGVNDVVNFFDRNGNNTLVREPLKETPPKVAWIKNGKCINKGQSICNLGYACDGCPWNFNV